MSQAEYEIRWQQFQMGEITREEWIDYCTQFLSTFLSRPDIAAIFKRMRDEDNQIKSMV